MSFNRTDTLGLTDTQLRATAVPVSGTFWQSIQAVSQSGTWNVTINTALPAGANVIGAVTQSGTWNIGSITTLPALVAGTALIGKVGIDQTTPGTTNAVAFTNTTLAVTGTFFQATQPVSIATAPVLVAGSALIGKVGIDQTTPGTTNAVAFTNTTLAVTQSGTWTVQPGNTANTTAWKVDGSAVTQPVSGTVTINAIPAGSAVIGKVSIDQTTPGTTNLVALAANQSTNISQMNGVTVTMGNGVSGTGVQRVSIASDSTGVIGSTQSGTWTVQPGNTANTTAWKVDGSAVTQPVSLAANQSVNVAQINGVTTLMGNGASGTGAIRVTVANDSTGIIAATQSGTWNITNVSGTISLPTGAATAAKQPALGTAGTASADVITVQGKAAMTPLLVDPSGVTSPVSLTTISTSVVPGTSATHLGKAEDAAHTTGDTGVFILAVRTDTPATTASATGDYDALHTGAEGGLQVNHVASAKTGMTRVRIQAGASNNLTSVKASAGVLWGYELFNNTAVVKYFKLYNKASAPVVASDTPVQTIIIPASGGVVAHMRQDEYATGIAYAIVGGVADTNATNTAAEDVHGALFYK